MISIKNIFVIISAWLSFSFPCKQILCMRVSIFIHQIVIKWFELIYLSIIRIVVCSDTFIIVFMHLKSKSIKSMTVKCITMIHVLQYIFYLNSHHHSAWVEKMNITFTFFFSELESRNFHMILILKFIHTMLLKGADIWQFGWDILTYSLF